eukprot:TRINITY_DN5256_c0_g1_i5.p1 TRINITY_DN5256_c0_g1~~TRINITY_DN5256_c0_g1_i5.p1  ORF type:complete len:283 (-),score=52.04 TRINITY_DN5256_c0_g1_i5:219-956(-)
MRKRATSKNHYFDSSPNNNSSDSYPEEEKTIKQPSSSIIATPLMMAEPIVKTESHDKMKDSQYFHEHTSKNSKKAAGFHSNSIPSKQGSATKWQSKILEENIAECESESPRNQHEANSRESPNPEEDNVNRMFNPGMIPMYPYGMMPQAMMPGGYPFNMVPYIPAQGGCMPMMPDSEQMKGFNRYEQLEEENARLREELNEVNAELSIFKRTLQKSENKEMQYKKEEMEVLKQQIEVLAWCENRN